MMSSGWGCWLEGEVGVDLLQVWADGAGFSDCEIANMCIL